jgi:TusA-related sulfurtransferase
MQTVDARGLACPLPLVKAKLAMETIEPGESILVLATDPEAPIDLAAWAASEGYGYEETAADGFSEFRLTRSQ